MNAGAVPSFDPGPAGHLPPLIHPAGVKPVTSHPEGWSGASSESLGQEGSWRPPVRE